MRDFILPTADEAKRIKAGDRSLINQYYMANIDPIRACAYRYCEKWSFSMDIYEDMAQDVYLHFEELNFESRKYFGQTLKTCFKYYYFGGKRKHDQLYEHGQKKYNMEELVFDSPVAIHSRSGDEDEGATLGELLSCEFDIEKEIEPQIDITDSLYNYLHELLVRSSRDGTTRMLDIFHETYYTGATQPEIGVKLGISRSSVSKGICSYMKKFKAHRDEISAYLSELGYTAT